MDFKETLSRYRIIVDAELGRFLDGVDRELDDGFLKANHKFIREYLKGGKRLRPILMIMAYRAFCSNDKVIPSSLSVELLHSSTLIHDDIMDEDEFRRKKATVYKMLKDLYLRDHDSLGYDGSLFSSSASRFAASNAVLCGNILIPLGADVILNSAFPEQLKDKALNIYDDAYRTVNYGQFLDIAMEKKDHPKEKEYLDMIEKKTACLFSASAAIGAVLAGAGKEDIGRMAGYAKEAAIAFQLIDDMMDISSDMAKGRELGSDIRSGKRTLLVIKALEDGAESEKKELLEVLGKKNASQDEIRNAISIIKRISLDYVRSLALDRIENAKKILARINMPEESRAFFNSFADYMAIRDK